MEILNEDREKAKEIVLTWSAHKEVRVKHTDLNPTILTDLIASALKESREAERDRCAKIALEGFTKHGEHDPMKDEWYDCLICMENTNKEDIAERIRQSGDEK